MAARQIQRRLLSLIKSQPPLSCVSRAGRRVQTRGLCEAINLVTTQEKETNEKVSNNVTYNAVSKLKTSSRHDLALAFTCKVCDTRSVKTACRESYDKGVVVVRCDGCNNLHLIADRLGWFGEPGCVEDLLAARGESIKKGDVDSLNLTLEDLTGSGIDKDKESS